MPSTATARFSPRQAAAQAYNYNPSQGNLVRIDSADANPSAVRPGQQVNLGMTYTILTPVQCAGFRHPGAGGPLWRQLLGQPYQTTVSNANGTFTDSVAYSLPSNAARGTYTVTSRVVSSYGIRQREAYFTVQ